MAALDDAARRHRDARIEREFSILRTVAAVSQ